MQEIVLRQEGVVEKGIELFSLIMDSTSNRAILIVCSAGRLGWSTLDFAHAYCYDCAAHVDLAGWPSVPRGCRNHRSFTLARMAEDTTNRWWQELLEVKAGYTFFILPCRLAQVRKFPFLA